MSKDRGVPTAAAAVGWTVAETAKKDISDFTAVFAVAGVLFGSVCGISAAEYL